METSELFEQLRLRIDETRRDRDRLLEAVTALDAELSSMAVEGDALHRLVARFETRAPFETSARAPKPADGADRTSKSGAGGGSAVDDTPLPSPGRVAGHDDGHKVKWPAGSDDAPRLKVKKIKAWSRYKLAAADWYLSTLRELADATGGLERVLGVEMAVDGAIASLCGAFDAGVFALTDAIERASGVPSERRTPDHLADWPKLAAEARFFDIDLACSLSISDALIGEHSPAPQGWLAQLQVLRQRAQRRDLLIGAGRRGSSDELLIDVPSKGPQPPLDYLSGIRDLIAELLETMLHDLSDASHGRLHATDAHRRRGAAEQSIEDLLPRH